MGLTKTDFMRGMQCRKMLWLDKHRPRLKVIPPEVRERLDAGNSFGDRAMGMFGPYEEMTVCLPGRKVPDRKKMLANTRDALARGVSVICEAAFSYYNHYCAVDILKKEGGMWDMYEVKNSPEVQEQFVRDAGFQYYILHRSGLPVGRIFLVLHGPDEQSPFLPVEITGEAKGYEHWVNEHIWALNRLQKETEEVSVSPGRQCTEPYRCWYYDYCHPGGEEGQQDAKCTEEKT